MTTPVFTGRSWELTYPNGAVVIFTLEWAATQALARSGGTMKVIEPPDPPPAP